MQPLQTLKSLQARCSTSPAAVKHGAQKATRQARAVSLHLLVSGAIHQRRQRRLFHRDRCPISSQHFNAFRINLSSLLFEVPASIISLQLINDVIAMTPASRRWEREILHRGHHWVRERPNALYSIVKTGHWRLPRSDSVDPCDRRTCALQLPTGQTRETLISKKQSRDMVAAG